MSSGDKGFTSMTATVVCSFGLTSRRATSSDVAIGTEVTVTGKVTTYRGRLQLTDYPDPDCAETLEPTPECPNESLTATAPALLIESQGNSVPEPVNVTLSELRSAGELLEGRLVALTGVYAADVRQNLPPPG